MIYRRESEAEILLVVCLDPRRGQQGRHYGTALGTVAPLVCAKLILFLPSAARKGECASTLRLDNEPCRGTEEAPQLLTT